MKISVAPRLASPTLKLRDLLTLLGKAQTRANIISLIREIRAREQILNVEILHKDGPAPHSPLKTSISILRETFPEWFDSRVEMENMLRTYVEDLEERIDELHARDNALSRKIRLLEKRIPVTQSDTR